MFQSRVQRFGGGASFGDPASAPVPTQSEITWIWCGVSDGSFENFPYLGSANHGGISRDVTACLMAAAQGLTSRRVTSGIGAICPGRWQVWQRVWRMGRTSL